MYASVNDLVVHATIGFDVSILAYGASGSGKTYTMIGRGDGEEEKDLGIIPRSFSEIFSEPRRSVTMKMVDICKFHQLIFPSQLKLIFGKFLFSR